MSAGPMPTARWRALGTEILVRVAGSAGDLELARTVAHRVLEQIDRACSRFREDSELTMLNARAGRAVRVTPLLQDAVEVATRAAELTDGRLDPCVGRALERAGYDRDWSLMSVDTDRADGREAGIVARRAGGWREIAVDRAGGTVRVPSGAKLDLGATAKALAAERACAAVHAAVGRAALVSVGGDIATRGSAPDAGWLVHVSDERRERPRGGGQTVVLDGGGLATSSTTARRWRRRGEPMHHIIDPRTSRPAATRWRTASVLAADCVDANIASTAALLLDGEAVEWLQTRELPARLVEHDGTVRSVAGWPEPTR
jgi:thiamine biosynthesis lipoprotein ApbE